MSPPPRPNEHRDGASRRDGRQPRPIGSELPILGPLWLLADRLLAATRLSPPRLYRVLWGQSAPQPPDERPDTAKG